MDGLKVPTHVENACCMDVDDCSRNQRCLLRAQYAAAHPELYDGDLGVQQSTCPPAKGNELTRQVVARNETKEDVTVPNTVVPSSGSKVSNKKKTTSFRGLA